MNENGKKRREWVKTAAIVFLSVMLVLTFFSQTILNYSLPEVATQYVQSGSITAKIRGTGVIESGDPYEVKVTESRKVSSVAVRVGDTVQKGDVLLYLEDSESEELKQAREELESAQNAYDLALLTESITSSDIYNANKDISYEALRRKITNAQAQVKAAEDAVKPLQDKVDEINKAIADIDAQVAYERSQDSTAESRVPVAKKALENAQEQLKRATADKENKEKAYADAVKRVEDLNSQMNSVSGNDAEQQLKDLQGQLTVAQADRADKETKKNEAVNAYNAAKTAEENAAKALAEAEQNKDNREANQVINNLNSQKAAYELQKYSVEKELAAAKAQVDEKKQELTEQVSNIGNIAGLEAKLNDIEKARKKVDELTEKAVDATVKADISGTVTAINVTAGNTTSAAAPVAVLQPEGKGYTLSFSVTNEQAKRLSVGDRADLINAWRYDDVEATLASIKPDRENPGQKKMLTFNITGEVVAGQTLNLSVGQKSANFDLIVPNSAIREDGNGKFILIVESRPSPLGNRYIATRVDVEVLASDDTQSAISGALYGYEYVITTATKPVEAGKQVRLADN